MDSLPPVFQANIPGQCTTGPSGTLLNIPNPGKFGIMNVEPSPEGNGECPSAGPPSFTESPLAQGSGKTNTASSAATPTSALQSSPSSFVTVTTPSSAMSSEQPKNSNSSLPATRTATSEAASTETGQPAWAAGMTRCPSADGTIYCYEDNTFGLCNQGWADPLPLNENQVCANGEITYKYNSSA